MNRIRMQITGNLAPKSLSKLACDLASAGGKRRPGRALCSNLSTLSSEKHVKNKTIYPPLNEEKAECFRSNAKIPPSQKPPQLAEEVLPPCDGIRERRPTTHGFPFLSLSFFSFLIEVSPSPPFPPLLLPETEFSNFPSSPGVVNSDFQPLPFLPKQEWDPFTDLRRGI